MKKNLAFPGMAAISISIRCLALRILVLVMMLSGSFFSQSVFSATDKAATSHHHAKHVKKHHHKKSKKHHAKARHYVPSTSANLDETGIPNNSSTAIEAHLVGFIQDSLEKLHYSVYKPGGAHFDESHGVYIADCSGYVDYVLKQVHPVAYTNLLDSMGVDKPNSADFYQFFSDLDDTSKSVNWSRVDDINELRPGDILVFRYKNSHGHQTGGHVMVVVDKPIRDLDSFLVRVADSAPAGHSEDTRSPHQSGIGVGLLQLKADPDTGAPRAFAWRLGSRWQHNVNIAMARPVDTDDRG